jgi:hypothetical protein
MAGISYKRSDRRSLRREGHLETRVAGKAPRQVTGIAGESGGGIRERTGRASPLSAVHHEALHPSPCVRQAGEGRGGG